MRRPPHINPYDRGWAHATIHAHPARLTRTTTWRPWAPWRLTRTCRQCHQPHPCPQRLRAHSILRDGLR